MFESFGKKLCGVSNGRYKAGRYNLGGYQGKDFPSHFVFFSPPDPLRTWHSDMYRIFFKSYSWAMTHCYHSDTLIFPYNDIALGWVAREG